jgi:hypothetical protein
MTAKEIVTYLETHGISVYDTMEPLHSLDMFSTKSDANLIKGVDYSKANWGDVKKPEDVWPVSCQVSRQLIQIPPSVLLENTQSLDKVVRILRHLKVELQHQQYVDPVTGGQ